MSDLKNCPFCNGTHSINVINFFTGDNFRRCDICGAKAPEAKTPVEAAEKWNTRPAEDAKDKEIKRLKADNQVYRDILNSLLNEEVYHLDNATMTNIKYELDNRGKDTNVSANAPDTNDGTMEEK